MTTTTTDLLTALGAHLPEFELPPIASVHLHTYPPGPPVTVQLTGCAPAAIAAGLLAWADTLTEISAEAWRVPEGDAVHLSVSGLLPGGIAVLVYGAVPVTDLGLGTDLAPNASTTVTLAALRHLATPGHTTDEATLR